MAKLHHRPLALPPGSLPTRWRRTAEEAVAPSAALGRQRRFQRRKSPVVRKSQRIDGPWLGPGAPAVSASALELSWPVAAAPVVQARTREGCDGLCPLARLPVPVPSGQLIPCFRRSERHKPFIADESSVQAAVRGYRSAAVWQTRRNFRLDALPEDSGLQLDRPELSKGAAFATLNAVTALWGTQHAVIKTAVISGTMANCRCRRMGEKAAFHADAEALLTKIRSDADAIDPAA
eukprot:scaffold4923_cov238-Pinguiococcus_pyrenoidosus.AAC.3